MSKMTLSGKPENLEDVKLCIRVKYEDFSKFAVDNKLSYHILNQIMKGKTKYQKKRHEATFGKALSAVTGLTLKELAEVMVK